MTSISKMLTSSKNKIGAIALVSVLAISAFALTAYARPPVAGVGDHVMKINLKGVPNDSNRACENSSSNNIYTMFDTDTGELIPPGHQHILWHHSTTNAVVDHCTENIDDDLAQVDLKKGTYVFTIRILGPLSQENKIRYCSQTVDTHTAETHCLLVVEEVRSKGKPTFTVPDDIFDDPNIDQIWSFVTGSKFRNAQIDIWKAVA
ncbi:MAG: hypothetical protein ACRD38_11755 [Nitrososphaerales archaeon]